MADGLVRRRWAVEGALPVWEWRVREEGKMVRRRRRRRRRRRSDDDDGWEAGGFSTEEGLGATALCVDETCLCA